MTSLIFKGILATVMAITGGELVKNEFLSVGSILLFLAGVLIGSGHAPEAKA